MSAAARAGAEQAGRGVSGRAGARGPAAREAGRAGAGRAGRRGRARRAAGREVGAGGAGRTDECKGVCS